MGNGLVSIHYSVGHIGQLVFVEFKIKSLFRVNSLFFGDVPVRPFGRNQNYQ